MTSFGPNHPTPRSTARPPARGGPSPRRPSPRRAVAVLAAFATAVVQLLVWTSAPPAAAASVGDRFADVVFVIDESGSMREDQAQVRARIGDMAEQLADQNVDFRFALVGYTTGPRVLSTLTSDLDAYDRALAQLRASGGTERAFAAIERSMRDDMGFREQAGVCAVLITDEDNDSGGASKAETLAALAARDATLFAVVNPGSGNTRNDFGPNPGSLSAETGGATFDIVDFRQDEGPVLAAVIDGCIETIDPLPPIADAGPDQTVPEGSLVRLDGRGSRTGTVGDIDFDAVYDPSAGELPTLDCPAWDVVDTAASDPVVADGRLLLDDSGDPAEILVFEQRGDDVVLEDTVVVEARVRVRSATTTDPAAAVATVSVTTDGSAGADLVIGDDEVFLLTAAGVRGPSVLIDTDNALHTYRMIIAPDGSVEVTYDGLTILTGAVFVDEATHGTEPRVRFGNGSALAGGLTEWGSVRHNVGTGENCPEALSYEWRLVSSVGSPITLSSDTSPTPSFRSFDDGSYEFELTVRAGDLEDTDRVSVTVVNQDPAINGDLGYAVNSGVVMVTAPFSDPGLVDQHTAEVDFGDGSPPVAVPVLAQGTGWGVVQATHVYAANGTFEVSVVLRDDDGGVATASTTSVLVEDAGGTIAVDTALFAADTTVSETPPAAIDVVGSGHVVVGSTHSNAGIRIEGGPKSFTGETTHVGELSASPSTLFDPPPAATEVREPPVTFTLEDYQPGGRATTVDGVDFADHTDACGEAWMPGGSLEPGLHWVPCDVHLTGANLGTGPITIVASGTISVTGKKFDLFEPAVDGLLFLSGSESDAAVRIAGQGSQFTGFVDAPAGGITVTGNGHDFECGLIGVTIEIAGSNHTIDTTSCPGIVRPGVTEVAVPASPLVAPTLTVTETADRETVHPAATVRFTSTVSNDGATVLIPGILAAQNLGTVDVTAMTPEAVVEYFDVGADAWMPLASTADMTASFVAEPPLGTAPIAPGSWSHHAAAVVLQLGPAALDALFDPARTSAVRVRTDVAIDPPTVPVRAVVGFGDDIVGDLAVLGADVADVQVTMTTPDGRAVPFASDTPGLESLAPGEQVTVDLDHEVMGVVARQPGESNDAYRERLLALDGAVLNSRVFATGSGPLGPAVAPETGVSVTERVPVMGLEITAPGFAAQGTDLTVGITIRNDGSADALAPQLVVTADGAPIGVAGVPATIAPGDVVELSAVVPVASDRTGLVDVGATLAWTDPDSAYGTLAVDATAQVFEPRDVDITIGDITGNFFAVSGTTGFTSTPADTPAFGQRFPNIAFNPPVGVVIDNDTGVGPTTVPFTDVITDGEGTATGTLVAGGNGVRAGEGDLERFDAVFTGELTFASPGEATLVVIADDAFVLGIDGVTPVSGVLDNAPAVTPFEGFAVAAASNVPGVSPASYPVTVDVPAPGTYRFELDYSSCCDDERTLVLTEAGPSSISGGGKVFVTGHDADFHAVKGPNPTGARHIIQSAVSFVSNRASDPAVLLVTGRVDYGSAYSDPVLGLQAAGITFDTAHVGPADASVLSLADTAFADYDVVVVASDYGGWLRQAELDELVARRTELEQFLSNGGGVVAFAQGGHRALTTADRFGFLPCVPPSLGFDQTEVGFRITPHGTEIGLVEADLNGNFAHNIFTDTCGMNVLDTDSGGRILSLATPGTVDGPTLVVPPAEILMLSPNAVLGRVGSEVELLATALSPSGEPRIDAELTLTVSGTQDTTVVARTDAAGVARFRYAGVALGTDLVQATGNGVSNVVTVDWSPSAPGGGTGGGGGGGGVPAPSIGGVGPADGTVVTETVPIEATITPLSGETILSWRVTAHPSDDPTAVIVLAEGTGDPPATLATFDATALPNGLWVVGVEAVGSGGGTSRTETALTVEGNLKYGRFEVTYVDLEVPVGGLPIRVLRTYDSFQRQRSGDFGHGWNLDVADFRVEVHRPLGQGGWEQYSCGGGFIFSLLCYRSSTPHYVTVTWPDGRSESFDFTPDGTNTFFPILALPRYTARAGATSQLLATAADESAGYHGDGNIYGGFFGTGGVYDPDRFVLRAKDGTEYLLDREDGLVRTTDPSGNTITIDDAGIHSSDGVDVTFVRDPAGRITAIDGPGDGDLSYAYDAAGDLVGATDPNGNTITYTYESGHYLASIVDALGTPFRRMEYDDLGRLTAIVDPDGNRTEVSIDPGARTETVVSPDGRLVTINTFDDRGNVIRRDEIADGVTRTTTFEYDAKDRVVRRTDPDGKSWTATYDAGQSPTGYSDPDGLSVSITNDATGRPVAWTNALGDTWRFTYDAAGRLTSSTDPLGAVSSQTYDPSGRIRTITTAEGDTTSYEYDAAGRTTAMVDPAGVRTEWTYDSLGRVASTIDGLGNTTSYAYDAVGNLVSTTDPLGRTTTWTYDAADRLVSTTNAEGETMTYGYDAAGRSTTATDAEGNTTTRSYDSAGRLVSTTDPTGATTTYTYDASGRLSSEVDPLGNTTTHTYDSLGRLASTTAPNLGTTTYTYTPGGRLLTVTDPLGATTTYEYDAVGRQVATVDPLGRRTEVEFDRAGRQVLHRNGAGEETLTEYDAAGRVVAITDPTGASTSQSYTGGRLFSITDPLGNATVFGYDAAGRRTSTTDALGNSSLLFHDAAGQLVRTQSAAGVVTTTSYDGAGRPVAVADALGNTVQTTYDDAGRVIAETDPRGNVTTYARDGAGRVTELTDALGGRVTISYDAVGRPVSVTDPNGGTRTTAYDPLGNPRVSTDALGRTTTRTFDLAGRPSTVTDARGVTVTTTYDAAGQPVSMDTPDGTITHTWDAAGRRTGLTDPHGTTTFGYDLAGRITSVTSPEGAIGYTYDAAGRQTRMALPDGDVDRTYDAAGNMITATSVAGDTVTFTYDPDGRPLSIDRPNGVTSTWAYDAAGRLVEIDHGIESFTYTLDPSGNRTAVTSSAGTEAYVYDALDRLTSVAYADGEVVGYSYDDAGNRSSETSSVDGTTTYTYDDAGQLVTATSPAGTTSFTYDDAGNLASTSDGDAYEWDWASRLARVTDGAVVVDYAYDGDGIRVGATGTQSASWLWDRTSALPTIVDDGTASYLHTAVGVAASTAGGATSYPLNDGLGSVRAVTDGAGSVTSTTSYDAFGGVRTGALGGAFGFTGEQHDATGLLHLRARQYDPATGRFLSADTVQPNAPGTIGWNLYSYANGNPTTYTDPSGHIALAATAVVISPQLLLAALFVATLLLLLAIITQTCVYQGTCQWDVPDIGIGGGGGGGSGAGAGTIPRPSGVGAGEWGQLLDDLANALRELSRAAVEAIAAACVANFVASGITGQSATEQCDGSITPLYLPGKDIPGVRDHIASNLVTRPLNVSLTYIGPGGHDRTWLNSTTTCRRSARDAARQNLGFDPPVCDEYPFRTAREGGQANYPARVTLQLIDGASNRSEGGLINDFYRQCVDRTSDKKFNVVPLVGPGLNNLNTGYVGSGCVKIPAP